MARDALTDRFGCCAASALTFRPAVFPKAAGGAIWFGRPSRKRRRAQGHDGVSHMGRGVSGEADAGPAAAAQPAADQAGYGRPETSRETPDKFVLTSIGVLLAE